MAQGREERIDPSSRLACGIPCGCGALTAGEGMMGRCDRWRYRTAARWRVGNRRYANIANPEGIVRAFSPTWLRRVAFCGDAKMDAARNSAVFGVNV